MTQVQRLANEARVCKRCGQESFDGAKRCAHCGGPVTTAGTLRVLGWVQIGLGSFLILMMSAISIFVAALIYRASDESTGTRFTGGPEAIFFIFVLFGVVMLFGVAAIVNGTWQVRYGRANRKLMFAVLALGLLFIIAGRLVKTFVH